MYAYSHMLSTSIEQLVIFGLIGIFISAFAWSKGYYKLPFDFEKKHLLFRFRFVVYGFVIYFFVSFLLAPFLAKLLFSLSFFSNFSDEKKKIFSLAILNSLIVSSILILLLISLIKIPPILRKEIIKPSVSRSSYLKDIGIGLLSWIIAFPLVMFISKLIETFMIYVFHIKEFPEQVAIYYLKKTIHYPSLFTITLITICVFAPLIEEYLFRGLLQNFLKNKLGRRAAILLTSFLFALFHFSVQQTYSNIIIIISLFILALFLGFIYERQKSLLTPIILHGTFNTFSILSLIFFKTMSN